ncbi:diadenosine tetraphosphate asymmetrical hydrolase [Gymnopus androsaceus JB14]|uniref:Bis(5'-adenosyl)-triphosphatase n=1 Tax=Gymnopus androsaceus JB14 TaxID=1447944 RepID=A0A6A4IGP2_9AGAR|nr:diadenosine tetraphosphate asymmetrical hydrolase [Gymnopus androsaceus JB14]
MASLFFSSFEVTRQCFYRTSSAYAIVNIKPITLGHVLVIPTRKVLRLADLNDAELASLMSSVQRVGNVVERAYGASALTIACQDGKAAGQSIPHVHFHIIPRKTVGDRFSNNDDIYPVLERAEGSLNSDLQQTTSQSTLKVDADENRKPRTEVEMEEEATWLRSFFV